MDLKVLDNSWDCEEREREREREDVWESRADQVGDGLTIFFENSPHPSFMDLVGYWTLCIIWGRLWNHPNPFQPALFPS